MSCQEASESVFRTSVAGSRSNSARPPHQRWYDFQTQKFYALNVREALHSFHPELPTQKIRGYDGLLPGPTLVERYGVPMTVRIDTDLPANTVDFGSPEITAHLHKLDSAPANTSEGGTQND